MKCGNRPARKLSWRELVIQRVGEKGVWGRHGHFASSKVRTSSPLSCCMIYIRLSGDLSTPVPTISSSGIFQAG